MDEIMKYKDDLEVIAVEATMKVDVRFKEQKLPNDLKINVYLLCFVDSICESIKNKQASREEITDTLNETLNMLFTENDIDLFVQKIESSRDLLN